MYKALIGKGIKMPDRTSPFPCQAVVRSEPYFRIRRSDKVSCCISRSSDADFCKNFTDLKESDMTGLELKALQIVTTRNKNPYIVAGDLKRANQAIKGDDIRLRITAPLAVERI